MKVTHITDYIIPMSSHSKSKSTKAEPAGEYRRDWTDSYGVRIRESYVLTERPSYQEWVRGLGINEMTHLYHPDAKPVADRINSCVGVPRKPTFVDELLGRDVWNPEQYE